MFDAEACLDWRLPVRFAIIIREKVHSTRRPMKGSGRLWEAPRLLCERGSIYRVKLNHRQLAGLLFSFAGRAKLPGAIAGRIQSVGRYPSGLCGLWTSMVSTVWGSTSGQSSVRNGEAGKPCLL